MADLTQISVPYPVLLKEYQERVGALTNENLMLRATVAYLQGQQAVAAGLLPEPAGRPDVEATAQQPGAES